MFTQKHLAITSIEEHSETIQQLYLIFAATLQPEISMREFRMYYFKHKPHLIDLTFIQFEDRTVGFMSAAFYRHHIAGRDYTICRTALGILEQFRGGGLPSWTLCKKYISYKVHNPSEQLFIAGFMANPLMYGMICKYTNKVYPKVARKIPGQIVLFSQHLIRFYNLEKKVLNHPFVLKIHFQVCISAGDRERIANSTDKNVRFYQSINGDRDKQAGVLTIIPVTWDNILSTLVRSLAIIPATRFLKRNQYANAIRSFFPGFRDLKRLPVTIETETV